MQIQYKTHGNIIEGTMQSETRGTLGISRTRCENLDSAKKREKQEMRKDFLNRCSMRKK